MNKMFAHGFKAPSLSSLAYASMRRLSTAPSLPTLLYLDSGILAINKPHGFICQYDMHKEVRYIPGAVTHEHANFLS